MKSLLKNPFISGFIILVIFRVLLFLVLGPTTDGNFLILVIVPYLAFVLLAFIINP